jgi:DNA-binding transcriptional LysR family regulator
MDDEADYTYRSTRPLYEVERCIVMSDMPDWANVYRTPDRPNESLIYYQRGATIKLEADSWGTTIRLWRRNGVGMSNNLEACAR